MRRLFGFLIQFLEQIFLVWQKLNGSGISAQAIDQIIALPVDRTEPLLLDLQKLVSQRGDFVGVTIIWCARYASPS